ncbi:alpha/beta hydrolase [Rhodoligotrophos ferricapiens]|uniref:alpha/beta hydrolase n=1 Tax=Rhodoligotrophos ferricapiens TaxID=3069264 RepID=UPI00315D7E48
MSLTAYHHFAKAPVPGAPLVFAFHGTGGDEHQFTDLVQEILPKSGIIAPRGDVLEHGSNRFFRRTGEGVYDMDDLAARTEKMIGFIRAHKAEYEGLPVYGLGYSNGANILASVVLNAPHLFDRIVLMHPLIPWRPEPNPGLRRLEMLITAGRRDPICPLPVTQAFIDFLKSQGADLQLILHDGGHEVRPEELVAINTFLNS